MDREFPFCERIKDFFLHDVTFPIASPQTSSCIPTVFTFFHVCVCVCVCVGCMIPNKFAETDIYIYIYI